MSRADLIQKLKDKRVPDFLATAFEQQRNFILDKSTRKVVLCARRSGKSFALGIALLITAFKYPGSSSLFVSMSNKSCQKILFKHILDPLIKQFHLEDKVKLIKGDDPRVEFSNGSVIYLFGTDSGEDKKDDLLGQKNMLVVIDEAQDISINLKDLVLRVLQYTIADNLKNGAQMIMSGTPSDYTDTYFYDVTKDYQNAEGWSFHRWNNFDNPHMRDELALMEIEQKKANPNVEQETYYKQMTLGQWVVNPGALVYRPKPHNFIDEIPESLISRNDWQYGLGVDFGFTDCDAFALVGWLPDNKRLYVIETSTKSGNDDFSTAATIQRYADRFDLSWIVVDGSSKKTMETLRERFGLPLEATDKLNKFDCISVFNNDLESAVIQILPLAQEAIIKEWNKLIWDPNHPRKERDKAPNHCSDALLYAWRKATNWASVESIASDSLTHEQKYWAWVARQEKPQSTQEALDNKHRLTWSADDFD